MERMQRVVRVVQRGEVNDAKESLAYWLSRPPIERIQHVETLRAMWTGSIAGAPPRVARVARVVELPSR